MANIAVCAIASVILIFSPLSQKNVAVPDEHATYPQNGQTYSPTAKSSGDGKESDNKSDQATNKDQKTALYRQERYIFWGLVINGLLAIGTLTIAAFSIVQAKAAKDTVNLIIGKERSRLRVDIKPLVLTPKFENFYGVDFTVSIYGETEAYITETLCVAYQMPSEYINDPELGEAVMFPIHLLPNVIPPKSAPFEEYALLDIGEDHRDLILSEIKDGRFLVGIRGFIKYRDVFDRDHETRFRYVWKLNPVFGMLSEFGNWEKCGAAKENHET